MFFTRCVTNDCRRGEKDTQSGNLVLATCRVNNFFDLAKKTYNHMKESGLLDVARDKDNYRCTVDGQVS